MIQGVGQFTKYYGSQVMHEEYGTKFYPDFVDHDRWTPERYEAGLKSVHPRLTAQGSSSHCQNEYYIQDGSYTRLKNVQVGYTIPKRITKKAGFSNVRVYLSADNLYTWTNLMTKLIDPEQSNFYQYPLMKTYTIGLSVDL